MNSNCIDMNLNLWVKKKKKICLEFRLWKNTLWGCSSRIHSNFLFFFSRFLLLVFVEIYPVLERKNETKFLERSLGFTICFLVTLFFGFSVFDRFETIRLDLFLIGLTVLYFLF